ALCLALKSNTVLKHLVLRDCNMTDDSAPYLVAALSANDTIQELDLQRNKLTALKHVIDIFQTNSTLVSIRWNVASCPRGLELLELLRRNAASPKVSQPRFFAVEECAEQSRTLAATIVEDVHRKRAVDIQAAVDAADRAAKAAIASVAKRQALNEQLKWDQQRVAAQKAQEGIQGIQT
ncbi:unnamed protein product, partial [Polarella glacialis]